MVESGRDEIQFQVPAALRDQGADTVVDRVRLLQPGSPRDRCAVEVQREIEIHPYGRDLRHLELPESFGEPDSSAKIFITRVGPEGTQSLFIDHENRIIPLKIRFFQ
jgi:hypothetical protein